jgi:PKHD-type hydroxylase
MARPTPLDLPTARSLEAQLRARIAPCVDLPVFSPDECARIVGLRDTLGFDIAPIVDRTYSSAASRAHVVDSEVRKTERTHILATPATRWIFDRVGAILEGVNQKVWQFDIDHFEPFQLLCYPAGGHFDWHSDLGDRGISALRKVSATILLSAPDSYAGGDLQILDAGKEITPRREHGRGVFFPSFQNHRVLPVTSGRRDVLIVWSVGKRPLR